MKKVLLILSIVTFISCDSSEKECNHDKNHTNCDTISTDTTNTIEEENVEFLLDSLKVL